MMKLPSPFSIKADYPLSATAKEFIEESRAISRQILIKKNSKLALVIGPCSIHNYKEAIEYALLLKELLSQVQDKFYIVMRVFVEKPRTKTGWKGFIYDPLLDGSYQTAKGIALSRKLLLELAEMGMPTATELVDPLFTPYIEDLITWGFIGARTSASPIHRQLASGLTFPIGFKNSVDGNIELALDGVESASIPHSHIGIDNEGRIAKISTSGNPFCHLVLRGSDQTTNFDPISMEGIVTEMKERSQERLLVDCSHGNSRKIAEKQTISFTSVVEQVANGNDAIMGLMLESYLQTGKQTLKQKLLPGVSVTDSCLGWEETEKLIFFGHSLLSSDITMRSVQK
ncbi:MAG TPA: 3-deoxy-7-phosphoheptulonate synthase [Chlamydiales bacterium]|nr:3-deoxy-7-phosphoheptulonate synthase [Chlamydiales bacterium]